MINLKEIRFKSIKFKIFTCFVSVILALVVMSIASQIIYNNNMNKYKNLLSSIQHEMDLVDSCILVCNNLMRTLDKPETAERAVEIDGLIKELAVKKKALADSSSTTFKNDAKDFIINTLDSFINQLTEANAALASNNRELSNLFYDKAKSDLSALKENSRGLTKGSLLKYTSGMKQEIDFSVKITQIVLIIAWLVVLGIGTYLTFIIVNNITKGLNTLTEASKVMSSGDLSVADTIINSNDELEVMAVAFNQMKNSLKDIVKSVTVISYSIFVSARNLNKHIEEHFEVSRQVAMAIENMAQDAEKQLLAVKDTSNTLDKLAGFKKDVNGSVNTEVKDIVKETRLSDLDSSALIQNLAVITEALQNISGITERFAACSEEMAAASEEQVDKLQNMMEISEKLDENSSQLEKLIQNFKISAQ